MQKYQYKMLKHWGIKIDVWDIMQQYFKITQKLLRWFMHCMQMRFSWYQYACSSTEKKKPDVVTTPDTKNLCLAMLQVTTKCSWTLHDVFFVGLDLVLFHDRHIDKKKRYHTEVHYLFVCILFCLTIMRLWTKFCDICWWMDLYPYNEALVKP